MRRESGCVGLAPRAGGGGAPDDARVDWCAHVRADKVRNRCSGREGEQMPSRVSDASGSDASRLEQRGASEGPQSAGVVRQTCTRVQLAGSASRDRRCAESEQGLSACKIGMEVATKTKLVRTIV